ncbi:unnamed protein product [Sphenostylis stenocarpa]|uniref:BHLH domain-containing protein n=1 Tax=Sphenostylis stenocarpa TaxID=92480 RepID=A0AA86SDX4_9FABA|nr:unnamed protein product [Sphenostylis stenocarpa]
MEPSLVNDATFSASNPSLSEIWPSHFPSTNKRPSSLLLHTHNLSPNNDKHVKLSPPSLTHQNAPFQAPQPDATSVAADKSPLQTPKPKPDYIHVRARRGQATDSHSLAERARREKISERMKILQDLVPGCSKVIGKALVLDEIINYIQSLQRQVEFLSMKLEAVNSRLSMSPSIECFPSKEVATQPFDLSGIIFGSQPARGYAQGSQPGWLHMQITGGSREIH